MEQFEIELRETKNSFAASRRRIVSKVFRMVSDKNKTFFDPFELEMSRTPNEKRQSFE